jgi:hypothetical protein
MGLCGSYSYILEGVKRRWRWSLLDSISENDDIGIEDEAGGGIGAGECVKPLETEDSIQLWTLEDPSQWTNGEKLGSIWMEEVNYLVIWYGRYRISPLTKITRYVHT